MPDRSTAERIGLLAVRARLVSRAGRDASTVDGIGRAFRELAAVMHPDAKGGNRFTFELLVEARCQLLAEIARTAERRGSVAPATHPETEPSPRRLSHEQRQ